jgi:FkbM family methyltransferase
VEEEWMGRLIERLGRPSPTFLDVGAGVGYYCVLVKKLRPAARVIAVEALPRHARALRSTLLLKGTEGDTTL